jgi:hypothetical protein
VADYKLYFIDSKGHIFDRVDVLSASKDEAFACARGLSDKAEIEVWRAAKFLGRFLIGGMFSSEPRATGSEETSS